MSERDPDSGDQAKSQSLRQDQAKSETLRPEKVKSETLRQAKAKSQTSRQAKPGPSGAALGGRIGLLGLIALTFFTVSGGAYGLEPVVGGLGGARALFLIALVPVVWSLPIALVVGELASMLPVSGGYYRWVQIGLGDFWGFQEGWWSWLFTFVDMALYPVLSADILTQAWPLLTGHTLSHAGRLAFLLGFIWIGGLINWRGAHFVSRYSIATMIAVLAPFALIIFRGLLHPAVRATLARTSPPAGAVGVALAAVVWNYTGWDNVGTFAPEVDRPGRTYPRGLLLALLLIFISYALPITGGLRLDPITAHWGDGYFVQLGNIALGPALALIMALTATLSGWSQYTSQLVYVLPLPQNLARDRFLPQWLAREDQRGVPVFALIASTCIYSTFALLSFNRLLIADTLLYAAGLALEFAALIRLRKTHPQLARPSCVPFKGAALVLFCCIPMAVSLVTLRFAAIQEFNFIVLAVGLVATGPILYLVSRLWRIPTSHDLDKYSVGS